MISHVERSNGQILARGRRRKEGEEKRDETHPEQLDPFGRQSREIIALEMQLVMHVERHPDPSIVLEICTLHQDPVLARRRVVPSPTRVDDLTRLRFLPSSCGS